MGNGLSTTEYLSRYEAGLMPGELPPRGITAPFPENWGDGTPRLHVTDLSEADRMVFTRYADCMVYDIYGAFILELCIAKTELVLQKGFDKWTGAMSRLVAYAPRNKTGRNTPCPCGSEVKYKRCHGRNKVQLPEEHIPDIVVTPELQSAAQAFAEGEISPEELYAYAGFEPTEDGEYIARK